jgi:hypothetical protein
VREGLVGSEALGKQQAQAALALSNGTDVEAMSAIALALAGDSGQSTRLASDLANVLLRTRFCSSIICRRSMQQSLFKVMQVRR